MSFVTIKNQSDTTIFYNGETPVARAILLENGKFAITNMSGLPITTTYFSDINEVAIEEVETWLNNLKGT